MAISLSVSSSSESLLLFCCFWAFFAFRRSSRFRSSSSFFAFLRAFSSSSSFFLRALSQSSKEMGSSGGSLAIFLTHSSSHSFFLFSFFSSSNLFFSFFSSFFLSSSSSLSEYNNEPFPPLLLNALDNLAFSNFFCSSNFFLIPNHSFLMLTLFGSTLRALRKSDLAASTSPMALLATALRYSALTFLSSISNARDATSRLMRCFFCLKQTMLKLVCNVMRSCFT
mmetsp:Transcript_15776/g.33950  ORF Transcript_15776/g.33950 Transcript_15776/m.33950 type:complete len:225 (+) Transcript_15776:802-1476(+)